MIVDQLPVGFTGTDGADTFLRWEKHDSFNFYNSTDSEVVYLIHLCIDVKFAAHNYCGTQHHRTEQHYTLCTLQCVVIYF